MTVSNFLNYELVDFASYTTMRQIASLVDGLKNSSRKVVYTVQTKIKDDTKVEILSNITSVNTEYLHGSQSLHNVAIGLAQNYSGSNNIPLLIREGIFGSRFEHEASAPRYIFTNKEPYFDKIFRPEMNPILTGQIFEGTKIEPRFYVPTIPLLLINGSEGVATGFAQKILPRNPKSVIKYVEARIKSPNKIPDSSLLKPWFNGFTGEVESGEKENQWLIKGKFEKLTAIKIRITEIPVQYSLESYTKVLDKLEDSKFIRGYKDISLDDIFTFEVEIDSKVLKDIEYEVMLDKLGLIVRVTENFTCLNEFNRIEEYTSAQEIIEHFLKIRVDYSQRLKDYTISEMKNELIVLKSKYFFIKGILEDKIQVYKKSKVQIVEQLEQTTHVIKVNDSYDYLVNMPIHSLSKETFEKLANDIKSKKVRYDEYCEKTIQELYLTEIKELNTLL